jgi:hypothetical protein
VGPQQAASTRAFPSTIVVQDSTTGEGSSFISSPLVHHRYATVSQHGEMGQYWKPCIIPSSIIRLLSGTEHSQCASRTTTIVTNNAQVVHCHSRAVHKLHTATVIPGVQTLHWLD